MPIVGTYEFAIVEVKKETLKVHVVKSLGDEFH